MLMKRIICSLSVVLITLFPIVGSAKDWYVDNAAKGANSGISWEDAWQSLSAVVWGEGGVAGGDTLFISGGSSAKTYNETLNPTVSGSSQALISIKPGQNYPHNGVVTLTNNAKVGYGINLEGSYIVVDGRTGASGRHIRVTGCGASGVTAGSAQHHNLITYCEIDANGGSNTGKRNDNSGVYLENGSNLTDRILEVSFCRIHDNYLDGLNFQNNFIPGAYGRYIVHDNEIYNLHDDGIHIDGTGLDVYNNYVYDLALPIRGHSDGVQADGGYCRIWNNIFRDLSHPAAGRNRVNSYIVIAAQTLGARYAGPQSNWLVYNNLCVDTMATSPAVLARGIYFTMGPRSPATSADNVLIANNTIIGMPYIGLGIYNTTHVSSFTNLKIYNNIIYNCRRISPGKEAVVIGPNIATGSYGSGRDLEFDYNIIHQGKTGSSHCMLSRTNYTYGEFVGSTGTQSHITGHVDPLLDPGYKLTPSSPGINAALPLSLYFTTDNTGTPRPQGSGWDIGAFEYTDENQRP
jgi:hypothetical protein